MLSHFRYALSVFEKRRLPQFVATGWLIGFLSVIPGVLGKKPEPPLKLKIVDQAGQPVACQVQRISPTGTIEVVGHTDSENPVLTISDGCKSGCRLIFVPDAASIYYRDFTYCPYKKETFVVTSIKSPELKQLGKFLNGPPELAAFAANEIADQITKGSVKHAYEIESYVAAGTIFRVPKALDIEQGKVVVSGELEQKIKEFQKSKGMKATGNLDYMTLQEVTGGVTTARLLQQENDYVPPRGPNS
jgi:hypothetical protein